MKHISKNSLFLLIILLIFVASPTKVTGNTTVDRSGFYSGKRITFIDDDNNGIDSNGGFFRAGGSENGNGDGGNPNKMESGVPVGDCLPVLLLGVAMYGVYVWRKKDKRCDDMMMS